jgi:hypothetical protein
MFGRIDFPIYIGFHVLQLIACTIFKLLLKMPSACTIRVHVYDGRHKDERQRILISVESVIKDHYEQSMNNNVQRTSSLWLRVCGLMFLRVLARDKGPGGHG